jgi:hypothetical protein
MSTHTLFVAEARPLPVDIHVPGGGTITVTAEPDGNPAGTCRWQGKAATLVPVGGQAFEAEVTVTIAVPCSRKWKD